MHIPSQVHEDGPFKVIIKPRSEAHAELIRRECRAVAEELEKIGTDRGQYKATV